MMPCIPLSKTRSTCTLSPREADQLRVAVIIRYIVLLCFVEVDGVKLMERVWSIRDMYIHVHTHIILDLLEMNLPALLSKCTALTTFVNYT